MRRILALLALAVVCLPASAVTVEIRSQGAPAGDVIVALDPLDGPAPPASAHATIDQVSRHFVPRVAAIRTGTTVDFPNSDNIRHQVYSFSAAKPFTLKLYSGRAAPPVLFDKAGLVVLGCNIHDSMIGFVAVLDTPYFGRTDAAGHLSIPAPPGRYRLRVWHPDLERAVVPTTVQVGRDEPALRVDVSLGAAGAGVGFWVD